MALLTFELYISCHLTPLCCSVKIWRRPAGAATPSVTVNLQQQEQEPDGARGYAGVGGSRGGLGRGRGGLTRRPPSPNFVTGQSDNFVKVPVQIAL